MGEVVSLTRFKEENTSHISDPARCLCCQHEWQAVAPVGTDFMECPECHTHKGAFTNNVMIGELAWACHCGSDLFRIHPEKGVYCPVCGQIQEGY